MGLHIGWHGMLPYLTKVEADDTIQYIKFIERYKIEAKLEEENDDSDEEEKKDKQEYAL